MSHRDDLEKYATDWLMPRKTAPQFADDLLAAGWRPPARTITTEDELTACHDFAVLHWIDDAGLPHAYMAAQMKTHVGQLGRLLGDEPMWPMTVLHEGGDE